MRGSLQIAGSGRLKGGPRPSFCAPRSRVRHVDRPNPRGRTRPPQIGAVPIAAIAPTEAAGLTGQYDRAVEATDLRAVQEPLRRCHARTPTPCRKRMAR
jgi:hypothetical protein